MHKHILIGGIVVIVIIGALYGFNKTKHAEAPTVVTADQTMSGEKSNEVQPTETSEPGAGVTPNPQGMAPSTPATEQTTTPAPKPVTQANIPYTATVVYTGTEFVPEEITVIEGGTVTFVNQSNEKMWIATDNHPTHDRYPIKNETSCSGNTFDQCASIGKGGSWSFTFSRLGTWGYHNHALASDKGKVRVMTKEDYLEMLTKDKPEWSNY
jgi:plastocyanin